VPDTHLLPELRSSPAAERESWLHGIRRLYTRYERQADIREAFPKLGICVIALRHVTRMWWQYQGPMPLESR